MKNYLYIYGGEDNKKLNNKSEKYYSYQLSSGTICGDNIVLNDSRRFLSLSKKLRDPYAEYIFSLNKKFIKEGLIYNNSLSLFFLTEISNKRTEIYDTYQSICHIKIIDEKLKKYKIDEILLDEVSSNFYSSIKLKFGNKYRVKALIINSQQNNLLKYLIKQSSYLIKSSFAVIINYFFFYKSHKIIRSSIHSLFLTRYPKHFNNHQYDSKYNDFFNFKKDYYLISILSDGFHQNVSVKDYIRYCKELNNAKFKFILLDSYLSLKDVYKAFKISIMIYLKTRKLVKQKFIFSDIDISDFLYNELFISIQRIPRLIMYESPLKRILSSTEIHKLYYYLFEFCYGRYFTYMFKTYSTHTKTFGFQHGPNSQRHIMFFLAHNEPALNNNNYISQLPIPDKVLAENKYSKQVYEDGYYNNVEIMERIYRLSYLNEIKRNEIVNNTVLVAAAMHDGAQLLNHLKEEMINNKDTIYYFKFHPRAEQDIQKIKKLNKPNIIAASDTLTKYLSFVSKVVVTQSSVGYEAYLLGIPAKVVSLPNKINDSPLLDIYEKEKSSLIEIDYY